MTFKVGQKVVCIDDTQRVAVRPSGWFGRFRKFKTLGHNLNKGDVYTVTAITTIDDAISGQVFQILHLDSAWHFGFREIGFPSVQFRPVAETKTDISIFTRMITPKRERVPIT